MDPNDPSGPNQADAGETPGEGAPNPWGAWPAPGRPGSGWQTGSSSPGSWPVPSGTQTENRPRYPYAPQGGQPYGSPYGGQQYSGQQYGGQQYGGQQYGGYGGAPGGQQYGGPGGPYGGGPGGPYRGGPGGGSWDPWNRYAPAQPSSRPWVALGVALAIIVAAVLGFGLVSQMNGTRNNNALGTNPYYSGTSGNPALGAQVATKVDPGIVDINTVLDFGQGQAAGTGIILNSSGEVLTNNHVVEDATTIQATVVTTGKVYTGSVVGWDLNDDVAVVQLQGASGLQPASLGDSDKVGINDQVVALGNALGVGGMPSVAQGAVVALNQSITASDSSAHSQESLSGLIETNATLEPGDSGGPLANANGQVIGMDTAASTNYQFSGTSGSSYAIPINQALSIAKQIEAGQNSGNVHNGLPGFLGVDVSDLGASGAQVVLTLRNTAASSAGIGPGDVITSVAGQAIGSASDLTSVMSKQKPGAHVSVKWTDTSGQDHSASLTLTTGPVP